MSYGGGNYGQCRSCGQMVVWIRMKTGKSMPCNPEMLHYKETRGGSQKIVTPNGEVLRAEIVDGGDQSATGIGYISHFATCPNAGQYRKRK